MGFIKDIKEIKEAVNEMREDTFTKAKKYDEVREYLKHIVLDVKNISLFLNEDGSTGVKIDYTIPPIKLFFDGDNKVLKNERFVAINMLDLISKEDMYKITEKLVEAQEKIGR